jgi:anaerobic magnesium-protoporphyrin IX monomethyl ester cyclase
MSDVLLTHSNHVYSDRKQTEKMQPYPPLQTLLVAAVLRAHEIDVALFDPALVPPDEGFVSALERNRPACILVCEDDFNFLSKMCLLRNRELAFRMAARARERGIPAYAHGADASDHVQDYLAAGFTAVLIGEAETMALEVAQGRPLAEIPGLAYGRADSPRYGTLREPRASLDSLPLPAWDLVDMDCYRRAWKRAHGYFSLNINASRGCPYRCNWCSKPIYGHSYRVRSARSVAGEMSHLKTAYKPDHIWFTDDIFALSGKWANEFAAAVQELDAQIPFKMQSRCDLMTRTTVRALRDAGCAEVWIGAESGAQSVLDAMDKAVRVEQIYEARENLRRHGIRTCFFLQFGYPGETWTEIEQTIRMVRETAPDDVGVSISYPLPGTKFYNLVSGQLGAKKNWSESNDLSMMFQGTYSSEFYRALSEAVHLQVRGGDGLSMAWDRVAELREAVR